MLTMWVGFAHLHGFSCFRWSNILESLGLVIVSESQIMIFSEWSVPSTRHSCCESLENRPDLNICTLATANPSDRVKVWPDCSSVYFQVFPAPASSNTETTTRSTNLRASSFVSGALVGWEAQFSIRRWTRSIPASRCRQRPWMNLNCWWH